MSFIKIKGFKGKIYEPDDNLNNPRKCNCPDCYVCLMCSDSRCELCINRNKNNKCKKK